MKNKYLILLLCSILTSFSGGCQDKKSEDIETISINASIVDKGGAFSNFDFIKLETNDECLLEGIAKIIVYNNNLYLLSSFGGNIYKFDIQGNYISKLKQGNGPGELVFVTDFCIDILQEKMYVLDTYKIVKEYGLNGEYIKETKLENPFFSLYKYKNEFLYFDPNIGRSSDFHLHVMDISDNKSYNFLKKNDNFKNVPFISNVFTPYNKDILISYMTSDIIYLYSTDLKTIKPQYRIDFNAPSIYNISEVLSSGKHFDEICKKNEYISGFSSLSEMKGSLFFNFTYHEKPKYVLYDIEKKDVRVFDRVSSYLPNSTQFVGLYDDSLLFAYDINSLMEYFTENSSVLTEKLEEACKNENDNPILIKLKL